MLGKRRNLLPLLRGWLDDGAWNGSDLDSGNIFFVDDAPYFAVYINLPLKVHASDV